MTHQDITADHEPAAVLVSVQHEIEALATGASSWGENETMLPGTTMLSTEQEELHDGLF